MKKIYKQKAKEIFDKNIKDYIFPNSDEVYDAGIKSMCQLAEEVENTWKSLYGETMEYHKDMRISYNKSYSKEQVEEFLEKQRMLCAEEVYTKRYIPSEDKFIEDNEDISLYCDEFEYYNEIFKPSILNAKLKI